MRGSLPILILLFLGSLFGAGGVEVGQYDDPRDLTIKIVDPFSQENTDLMQPVVGEYDIKVLPPHISDKDKSGRYNVQGLYFKQIGKFIYIDIRQPPNQKKAGAYDLFVSLKVPGQADTSNRLRRNIIYTDAATDVLLLIDNSMSMKKNDPKGLRFKACENFVRLASLSDKIEKVGIVKFSGSASKVLDWMPPHVANKKGVGSILASQREGSFTNINEAFELATEMFENSVATEKVAILLTDGKNEPDRYRDTHDFLRELGVKIYTVALSDKADVAQLEIISEETGGESFKAVDDGRLMQIYNKIAQQLNEFRTLGSGENVKTLEFPLTSYDQLVEINLYGYPKGASFVLKDQQGSPVNFQLITGGAGQQTTLLRLSKPKSGIYLLESDGGSPFSYDINTQSKLSMKLFPLDNKYLRGEVAHFAISLAHLQMPILNADVFATLSKPDGQVMKKLQLFDDGVHGDNHADDGVYCGILPLDFPEGIVEVEFFATGKTADGQKTVRIENDSFRILEAGRGVKDYFLASILPLYIDYGKVKQGSLAKASLRLSFEGRQSRKVSFEPGEGLVSKIDEGSMVPWEAFSFPESFELEPSEAKVVTLSLSLPASQALGPYSGSFMVQIGDQALQVPIDINVQKGDLVRMATGVKVFEAIPKERPAIVEPLEALNPEPDAMTDSFSPKDGAIESAPVWKEEEGVTKLDVDPKDGVLPDSMETVEEEIELVPIEYSISPESIDAFKVEEGDYASLIFTFQNHSDHAGNVMLKLDGPGVLDRSEIRLEAGANIAVGWYWEAGELDLAQRKISLRATHLGEELQRSWVWEPIPKQPPWALIYTLILLGIVGLAYGVAYLMGHLPSHAYVSLSAWFHFFLVLWAFWHLLPINFEEIDLDRDLLTFELEWEEPREREVEVPEEELKTQERPKEEGPQPQQLQRVVQENKVEREMKAMPKLEQPFRSLSLKSTAVELKEQQRELTEESMVDATPTVLSVNDRPKRRAVLKKRDPSKVVSKKVEREKEKRVIRRQRTGLEEVIPKPSERDLELSRTENVDKLPEIQPRTIDPTAMKPMEETVTSELELEDKVQQVKTRQKEQEEALDRELKVNPLQQKPLVARASSANIMEETRPVVRKVELSGAQRKAMAALEGGVPLAEAPSVQLEAQSLNLEKEAVQRLAAASRPTKREEVSAQKLALDESGIKDFVPEKAGVASPSELTAWEGGVELQKVIPTSQGSEMEVGTWAPESESKKVEMKVEESVEETWVNTDRVKTIAVKEMGKENEEVNPSLKEEALASQRSFPSAMKIKEERRSLSLESSDSRLKEMDNRGLLGEQEVEWEIQEQKAKKGVRQGAGALMKLDEPKPSELPLGE